MGGDGRWYALVTGMQNLVCVNLVVALLAVLGEDSRRCGVFTRWYLYFCFSFRLSYHPLFPHLPLLTLPIVLVLCPRSFVRLDWVRFGLRISYRMWYIHVWCHRVGNHWMCV